MNSLRWATFTALLLSFCAYAAIEGPPEADSKEYGQTLVVQFDVPPSVIKKFNAIGPVEGDPNRSPLENNLLADSEDWGTPLFNVDSNKNPYTIVITAAGTAKADGKLSLLWLGGWTKEDSSVQLSPITGMFESGLDAGERLVMTAAGGAGRFISDRQASAVVSLVKSTNLNIETVTVQIWSGLPEASGLEFLFSAPALLIGLVMLVLWRVFLRR